MGVPAAGGEWPAEVLPQFRRAKANVEISKLDPVLDSALAILVYVCVYIYEEKSLKGGRKDVGEICLVLWLFTILEF